MELINISRNKDGAVAVSGYELYEYLEVKTPFHKWVKNRIEKYDFRENDDYILVGKKIPSNNPKNPISEIMDYLFTLDVAKELAMVENNDKGRQARKYFIEIEKRYKDQPKQLSQWEMMRALFNEVDEHKKEVKCLGGKGNHIYQKHSKKVFQTFWREFNRYFMIPRYGEIPKSKFNEAKEFISEWQPPTEIRMQLKELERQMTLFEGGGKND